MLVAIVNVRGRYRVRNQRRSVRIEFRSPRCTFMRKSHCIKYRVPRLTTNRLRDARIGGRRNTKHELLTYKQDDWMIFGVTEPIVLRSVR